MTLTRLDSGYWHARFGMNRFIQWPIGRAPRHEDGFGWLSPADFKAAEDATRSDPPSGSPQDKE